MTALRYRLRSFAWLALVAMCALSLGPAVSRALGTTTAGQGMLHAHAHCVEMGAQALSGPQSDGGAAPRSGDTRHAPNLIDCCALCALAASPLATGSVFVSPLASIERSPLLVANASIACAEQRDCWSSAAPRGPPSAG